MVESMTSSGCIHGGGLNDNSGGIAVSPELAQAEAEYANNLALVAANKAGYKVGTDQAGHVYVWMPGSQVCSSSGGVSAGCGTATSGQWVKLSNLDQVTQWDIGSKMIGYMAGSMTDSRMYIGWTGLSVAAGYVGAPTAYKEASVAVVAMAEQYGIPATTALYFLYRWGWNVGKTPPLIGPTLRWVGEQYCTYAKGPGC